MLPTIYESFRTLPCPINPPREIIWYEAGDAQQIQIFSWAGCGLFFTSLVIHFPQSEILHQKSISGIFTVHSLWIWFQHEICTLLVYYSFKPHSRDFDCLRSLWSSPTHFLMRQLASPCDALLLRYLETCFTLTVSYRHHLKVRGHVTVCCILFFCGYVCLFPSLDRRGFSSLTPSVV